MRKLFTVILTLAIFAFVQDSFAQLTGIKTIPGNYATISAAITDLNTQGVGSGGVTFNVAAGFTETAANLIITATGTSANPIVFQKSGAGANPLITAGVGVSTTLDGMIILSGADYVTFNGIDLMESAGNTTTTTQMEWGYAILKVDGANGSQNNSIKNCVISLNKTNTNSKGIYVANHTTASTTVLTVTAFSGTNSQNMFNGNTIQNCYIGVNIAGYSAATPFDLYDHYNQVGYESGNTIRYFGGGASTAYGIYTIYQDSLAISNNNISGGTGTTTTQYGIMISTATNASVLVYNNTVSDTTSTTTSSTYGIALNNAGVTGTDNTVIVKRNTVQGMHGTALTSGSLYGYYIYYTTAMNLYVDSNKFINNKWGSGTTTATGTIYGMYIYPYTTTPVAGSVEYITNNYLSGNNRKQSAIGAGTTYGMYIYYSQETANVYNNTIENDTLPSTGTSYGIYIYQLYATTANYYNNAVRNIYRPPGSAGIFYGIYVSNSASSGTTNYYNNTVNNISTNASTSSLYGQYMNSASITKNIYNNTVHNLSASSTGNAYGFIQGSGTTTNIYKNSIYDLRVSTGIIYGLYLVSGTTNNVYNNYISDLRADSSISTSAISGIYMGGGTTNNIYYNTIYINSVSTGTTFGTTGIYALTTSTLDLRNNNIVNVSTPGATGGYTSAYYRSSATLTTYSSLSDNNNFYAGVPDTNRIIYFDGITKGQSLSDFKLLMSPRDANSVTENPPFVNVSTKPYDLRINAAIASQLESTGQTISTPISIVNDFDGQARYPNSGYPVNPSYPPTAPDIGADEFGGIPKDVSAPNIVYTPLLNTSSTTARTLTATITDAAGVPTSGAGLPVLYWRINAGSYSSATAISLGSNQYSFTFGSGVTTGNVVYYYICAQDGIVPPNVGAFPSGGASGFTANPPAASVPPTSPSSYVVSQAGLAGDYTVGAALFNQITGKNITFNKVVKKVLKEVVIEDPSLNKQPGKGDKIESETSTSSTVKGKKELREVDEISWIPMENGKIYNGELYIKKNESPNYNYPTGTDGIYVTLTAAIDDLNLRGVSGATRFLLTDTLYSTGETFPLVVNIQNVNKPTVTNTVTIKPNTGVTSIIRGDAPASRLFTILNNYFTIDGSNTTNGTTRDLTIQNTSVTTPQVVLVGSTGTTPITNVTVKNTTIINGVNSSTAMVISDGNASGVAGYFNNITVQNNSFKTAYMGVYSIATILAGNGSGLLITGNDFNTTATPVRLCKVYIQGVDGATVSNNNIGNDSNGVDASNITGIWFATGTVNSTISGNNITNIYGYGAPRGIAVSSAYANANINITGNTISGLKTAYSVPPYGIYVFSTTSGVSVTKNKVSNLLNTNTGGYGARGINIATSVSPANIDVINNFVWNIVATNDASATYWSVGIAIDATISNVNVYFNSVNLYGSFVGYTSATVTTAFYSASGVTLLNLRNNIFRNSYNNLNTLTDKSYAIYHAGTNTTYTDINYNDYYATDSAGTLGYLGAAITTLPLWQTATGKDLNSVSGDPYYLADTNLHIDFAQSTPVKDAGQYIATVTEDIDGNTRYNPPDIGGDEGTTMPLPLAPTLLLPVNGATGVSMTPLLDWNDVMTATSYRIQITTGADSTTFATPLWDTTGVTVSQVNVPAGKLSQVTKYYWRVNATNTTGTGQYCSPWKFTTLALNLQLNLKVYLEGFWGGTTQITDTVMVYLANSTTFALVDTAKVVLSGTGTASMNFNRVTTGSYYIVVNHRNHLETWSKLPQSFVGGAPLSYDFTTAVTQAFGDNMKQVGSVWVLFGGDANRDGSVDGLDVTLLVPQFGSQGYLEADFDGDQDVTGLDVALFVPNFGMTKVVPTLVVVPVIKTKDFDYSKIDSRQIQKDTKKQNNSVQDKNKKKPETGKNNQ